MHVPLSSLEEGVIQKIEIKFVGGIKNLWAPCVKLPSNTTAIMVSEYL